MDATLGNRSNAYLRRRVLRLGRFQKDRCFYCDGPLVYLDPQVNYGSDIGNDLNVASIDHFVPKGLGGSKGLHNLVIAHRGCNSKKGHEMPSAEMVVRLHHLNEVRGFIPSDRPGVIRADTFSEPFPEIVFLCDMVNVLQGAEGKRIRRLVGQRLGRVSQYVATTKPLEDAFRRRVLLLLIKDTEENTLALESPYEGMVRRCSRIIVKMILPYRNSRIEPVDWVTSSP